jgi:hypothetical protein
MDAHNEGLEAQNVALEDQNGALEGLFVDQWSQIPITSMRSRIRIRILKKVMWIRNPAVKCQPMSLHLKKC